jgi:hypothetical protein
MSIPLSSVVSFIIPGFPDNCKTPTSSFLVGVRILGPTGGTVPPESLSRAARLPW